MADPPVDTPYNNEGSAPIDPDVESSGEVDSWHDAQQPENDDGPSTPVNTPGNDEE